jgi:hypothetical protein
MRDLYARLSLSPGASDAEIKVAINACPHAELRSDAAAVLLHTSRRSAYDELHATLVRIGSLRASLGLVQTALWRGQREFNGEVTGTGSRYAEFIRKRDMLVAARRVEKVVPKNESPLRRLIRALRPSRKP